MMVGERQLTLVVPLQEAHPDAICHWVRAHDQLPCPQLPALATLLTRAFPERLTAASLDQNLCEWFGIDCMRGTPTAALRYLADTGNHADASLVCFDPVHLVADMDRVLLYDAAMLDLEYEETVQLVTSINEFLAMEGMQVIAPSATHWYLHGAEPGNTVFSSIDDVAGQNILPAMPRGDAAQNWRKLLNEIQILLHAHPVNTSRSERGLPTVNGVWPWGKGKLTQFGKPRYLATYSENTVLNGMADAQAVDRQPPAMDYNDWSTHAPVGASLVLLTPGRAENIEMACQYLEGIEQRWFGPIARALGENSLQQFILVSGTNTAWRVNAKSYRQSWRHWFRRTRGLTDLCSDGES